MDEPAVTAHRGFAGIAPENTVAAARAAAERGATALEVDVQPAACGTPVVVHDARLDGRRDGRSLTDADGLVWETPLEAVRAATVLGSDETVPTLATLLAVVPATMAVNVELKNPGTTDVRPGESLPAVDRDRRRALWEPFVERVVDDCDAFDGEILFSSFCEGALAALREVAPEYAAAVIVGDSLADALAVARRYDCEAIHPPHDAIAGTAMADEPSIDVLAHAHEEGRAVTAWTVETWVQFDELRRVGVDGIIAEYPGLGGGSGR